MTIYDGRLQHDQRFGDPGLPCLALPRCSVVDESMRLGPDPAVINSKSANHRPSECHQSLFWQTRSGRYFPIEINLRLCLSSFAKQDLKLSLIQSSLRVTSYGVRVDCWETASGNFLICCPTLALRFRHQSPQDHIVLST